MTSDRYFNLKTELSVAECVARLRAVTAEHWLADGDVSGKSIIGIVDDIGFRWRKMARGRKSYQMQILGRFRQNDSHTQIECRAGIHTLLKILMALFFSPFLLTGFFLQFTDIPIRINGHWVEDRFFALLSLIPFLLVGMAGVWITHLGAREELSFMRDLLRRVLDAEFVAAASVGQNDAEKPAPTPQSTRRSTVQR